jgi:hypothetical protein
MAATTSGALTVRRWTSADAGWSGSQRKCRMIGQR